MRQTTQRSLILEYLRSTDSHPSAKDVYDNVKRRLPGVSVSTVYRTLSWLRDNGEALELSGRDGASHYDGDVTDHAHLSCVSCGKIKDLDVEIPKLKTGALERKTGFQIQGRRLELFGLCGRCQEKESK